MAFALAAFDGEVPHQVFVSIPEDIVPIGSVLGEVQCGVFEDRDQVREAIDHFLARTELRGIVEVGHVRQLVRAGQWGDDLFVDLVPDIGFAFEGDHVLEARLLGYFDRSERLAGVLVADVFDEQQDQHIVFVLARIHAATEFIAARPEG